MSNEQLSRIERQFTRTADVYARMRQTTDERSLDLLVALCEPKPSAHALDVACGPGFLALALAQRTERAIGLDATGAFLELARAEAARRGLRNVTFEKGDAECLPYESASLDVVTCRAAFHHFPRPERVLSEMARVMRPAGRILVADLLGSERSEQALLHDEIERLCDPTHERALPISEFRRLFQDAGLELVREIESSLDYAVDEWIDHGDPSPEARGEITSRMESSLEGDRAGLNVRREGGELRFRHRTAAFVLERVEAD